MKKLEAVARDRCSVGQRLLLVDGAEKTTAVGISHEAAPLFVENGETGAGGSRSSVELAHADVSVLPSELTSMSKSTVSGAACQVIGTRHRPPDYVALNAWNRTANSQPAAMPPYPVTFRKKVSGSKSVPRAPM